VYHDEPKQASFTPFGSALVYGGASAEKLLPQSRVTIDIQCLQQWQNSNRIMMKYTYVAEGKHLNFQQATINPLV